MTREEAKNKLDFLKKSYQKLIDEKVDSGKLVGSGVRGEWKAETPLDEVYKNMIEALDMAIKELEKEHCDDTGEISDGYHTFNQLYHQRAILFATIVNQNTDRAWKSYKHSDGKYCFDSTGEWFIVGVDTPDGSYTYHYSKEYWDYFECKELDCGKEWDGHTEEDVTRLLSLKQETCENAVSRQAVLEAIDVKAWEFCDYLIRNGRNDEQKPVSLFADNLRECVGDLPSVTPQPKMGKWERDQFTNQPTCSVCGYKVFDVQTRYCPNCGAKM